MAEVFHAIMFFLFNLLTVQFSQHFFYILMAFYLRELGEERGVTLGLLHSQTQGGHS